MIKKGMRRQIVLHYILVVFVALLLVETIFLLSIRTYYYNSIYSKNHHAYQCGRDIGEI
ncbi:hypothetical protein ACFTAO_25270 [Paenibacillus rhizoplanae]